MLGIEEMAAIFVLLLAIEGLYLAYMESTGSFANEISAFTSMLKENEVLQKFYVNGMQSMQLIEAIQNATGCSAYNLYTQNAHIGTVDRVILSEGYAYVVYCDESSDNS